MQLEIKLIMSYDILQSIPQGGNGAQDAEDSRIAEIADELERLCRIHEAQRGAGQSDVVSLEEQFSRLFVKPEFLMHDQLHL